MANRFWVGNSGNWNDTANWDLYFGGAGGYSVPGDGDDAYFVGPAYENSTVVFDIDITCDLIEFWCGIGLYRYTVDFNGKTVTCKNGIGFNGIVDSVDISSAIINTRIWGIGDSVLLNSTGSVLNLRHLGVGSYVTINDNIGRVYATINVYISPAVAGYIYTPLNCSSFTIIPDGECKVTFNGTYGENILTTDAFAVNSSHSDRVTLQSGYPGDPEDPEYPAIPWILSSSSLVSVEHCTLINSHSEGATSNAFLTDGNIDGGGNAGWNFVEGEPPEQPPTAYPPGAYNEGDRFSLAPGIIYENVVGSAVWNLDDHSVQETPISPTHNPGCGYWWALKDAVAVGVTNPPAAVNKALKWLGYKGQIPWIT